MTDGRHEVQEEINRRMRDFHDVAGEAVAKMLRENEAMRKALKAAERIVADRVAGGRMVTNREDAEAAWLLCKEALGSSVGGPT